MYLNRRKLLQLAAMGGAAGVLPFAAQRASAQTDNIRVGFPVPLTGPFGTEARDMVRGAEIAVREFNDTGGLNRRKAELVVRDDKLNVGEAAAKTLELIEKERVHFVAGALGGATQLAVNSVTRKAGVIYNSVSTSDTINEAAHAGPLTFHEGPSVTMYTNALARHVFPKYGKKVAFLYADYAFGQENMRGLTRAGAEFGIEVVAQVKHPLGATDYAQFLPQIQALKPDILFICNWGRDQQISLKQAGDFGLKKSMKVFAPILSYEGRLAAGHSAYEGVIGTTPYYWRIEDDVPTAKAFNTQYRNAHNGDAPSEFAAMAYSGVRALLEAAKVAGTTDAERVAAAMRKLKYDYVKGQQYFRACDQQSVQPILLIESRNPGPAAKGDVFQILSTDRVDESRLRTCQELGLNKS